MDNWYCAGFMAQKADLAVDQLQRQGYRAFCPKFTKTVSHARRKQVKRAPLFPGYLFVQFDASAKRWRAINGTRGVTQLIQIGNKPARVRGDFIQKLQAASDGDDVIQFDEILSPGDTVRAIGGALDDSIGTLCRMKDSERVVVLMSMLGREVEVTLPKRQLMKVG